MTPFERRIAALEAAKRAKHPAPNILRVPFGQSIKQARADFAVKYAPKPGHNVLVVPAKPRTDAEREVWAERFRERQLALVAAARRERIAVVKADQVAPRVPPKRWPSSPTIRPSSGPHIVWKPQC